MGHSSRNRNSRPGTVFEDEELTCIVTLRQGLVFHDADDDPGTGFVASLTRWMQAAPMGQTLNATLDELSADDDTHIRFRLKRRFPLLI